MYSVQANAALPALGLPIRRSADQRLFSTSPRLIAAVHVLHRLVMPRHPPNALSILTVILITISLNRPMFIGDTHVDPPVRGVQCFHFVGNYITYHLDEQLTASSRLDFQVIMNMQFSRSAGSTPERFPTRGVPQNSIVRVRSTFQECKRSYDGLQSSSLMEDSLERR